MNIFRKTINVLGWIILSLWIIAGLVYGYYWVLFQLAEKVLENA
jgi:uncharacterized membrane protein YpjA